MGAESACHCGTSVAGVPQTIAPGIAGNVDLRIHVPDGLGEFIQMISFYSDSQITPILDLKINGTVVDR
jgi:hypothetical protein